MEFKEYYDINFNKTITEVIKKLSKKEDEILKPFSLTHSHAKYIENIHRFKVVTMMDLTELSGTDKANTTRVVKDLLNLGIVQKSGGERKFNLTLTEKGEQIAEIFSNKKRDFLKVVLKDFTKEEIQMFKVLLEKLFIGTSSALKG